MQKYLVLSLLACIMLAGCVKDPVVNVPSPTSIPPTSIPPTSIPPTAVRTTSIPPTAVPTLAVPPTAVPTLIVPPSAIPSTATAKPAAEAEILFLRGGNLVAYGIRTRTEHTRAKGVRSFTATPDGLLLALVIGTGRLGEIWVAQRDGSAAQQVTHNERAEGDLSWAPDGLALAYSSVDSDDPHTLTWEGWSRWCAASEVRILALGDGQEHTLAPGCDPAFAPDGRRIAFATPPTSPSAEQSFLSANNAVHLVNRQGQNGWNFAAAKSAARAQGYLVYAPAWTPSGEQLSYQRFLGYRSLVDINITEIGDSFKGDGQPLVSGAGWMLPVRFRPDGKQAAVLEHNVGDARGGSGYETWKLSVVRLGVAGRMFLPDGEVATVGSIDWQTPRVTAAAWSPDGSSLALAMPDGWQPKDPAQELLYQTEGAGAIWRYAADGTIGERLVKGVDYASPILWLP